MSMMEWVKRGDTSSLIVFVHGLKGGIDTWSYDANTSFPKLLCQEEELQHYDVACFNYFTTFTNTYGASKSLIARLFGSLKSIKKNLPIDEIAELLKSELEINFSKYKRIVIIAHSMGGLVSKSCILKQLTQDEHSAVTGFISLAVPHNGAKIANITSMISSNVQLGDLGVLSNAIDQLNRDWNKTQNKPPAKYVYGAHDLFVQKSSALPIDCQKKDTTAVDEDHTSICKPKDNSQTVYGAIVKFINEFDSLAKDPLKVMDFVDEKQYDDHFFVLKLILADVHEVITGHAKSYFFNAEEARKIFTSENDRALLFDLYKKIENLYRQEYEYHIAHNTTPTQLVQSLHQKIFESQDGYLKSMLLKLEDEHKKGMLHQLANKYDAKIVWSATTTLEDLGKLKGDEL
ncbi:ABC-three component system protein [Pseudomonas sp. H3_D04]